VASATDERHLTLITVSSGPMDGRTQRDHFTRIRMQQNHSAYSARIQQILNTIVTTPGAEC